MENVTPMTGHNSAIAVYDEFRAQLGELKKLNEETMFNYEDSKGNKDARSHVYKLRQTKSAVEQARKKEKAESLEYGRRVDEQAKEIAVEIDKMIKVHAAPLEEIEQREKDRIEWHKTNLEEIEGAGRQTTEQWLDLPLEAMRERLAEVEAGSIGEDCWEEFALLAAQAKDAAIALMRDAIARREAHDAEQAELARLRKESADREQADRERTIREEATRHAAEEAEQKAKAERERAEAEATAVRESAERRELELKLAAETAEREKAEAEQRAATAAKDAEERVRREAADRAVKDAAEADAREADKKHHAAVNRAAVAALVKGGLPEDMAKQAVTLIAQKAIPNVSISY